MTGVSPPIGQRTEAQAGWAAELLATAPPGPVLELCAGVGHIGLGAVRHSQRRLFMVDRDPIAHRFAERNAAANDLSSRTEFRLAEMEGALAEDERFALIIADPPWVVRTEEAALFPQDPLGAIDGGEDGLRVARVCVDLIDRHLAPGGSALLQLRNAVQAEAIAVYAGQLRPDSVTVGETRQFDGGVITHLAR